MYTITRGENAQKCAQKKSGADPCKNSENPKKSEVKKGSIPGKTEMQRKAEQKRELARAWQNAEIARNCKKLHRKKETCCLLPDVTKVTESDTKKRIALPDVEMSQKVAQKKDFVTRYQVQGNVAEPVQAEGIRRFWSP